MRIGKDGVGRVRPKLPGGEPEKAGRAGPAFRAPGASSPVPAETSAAETSATARGSSAAMEQLRQLVGPVPRDTDAAAVDIVKGLLRAELGAGVAEQPGFEKLAASVAEKIKQDPMLGEKLRKVLGNLARP